MSKYKLGTARITLFNELGIENCYTLEASLFGLERNGNPHFTIKEYEQIGYSFVLGLHIYFMEKDIRKQAINIIHLKNKNIDCSILENETLKHIRNLELKKRNSLIIENKASINKIEIKNEILPRISKKIERKANFSSLSNLNLHDKKIDFPLKASNVFYDEDFVKNRVMKNIEIKFKPSKKKIILGLNKINNKEDNAKKIVDAKFKNVLNIIPN